MLQSLSPRSRRLVSSLAYTALVGTVAGLGYLTYQAVSEQRQTADGAPAAESATPPLMELSNFSARREKSSDVERLTISLRLRVSDPRPLDCYVYVIARNDRVSPKLWGVWPEQDAGSAVTAGGHFRGTAPITGQLVRLSSSGTRITATIDHPQGRSPFETATVYVVSPKGEVLLSRPFAL